MLVTMMNISSMKNNICVRAVVNMQAFWGEGDDPSPKPYVDKRQVKTCAHNTTQQGMRPDSVISRETQASKIDRLVIFIDLICSCINLFGNNVLFMTIAAFQYGVLFCIVIKNFICNLQKTNDNFLYNKKGFLKFKCYY